MAKSVSEKSAKTEKGEQLDGKSEALKLAVAQITKQFGEGSIMKLGESKKIDIELIHSGSLSLDLASTRNCRNSKNWWTGGLY